MSDEHGDDLIGRKLDNYQINAVLGQGGMSVMYRATDVRLGRKVALKVIGEHLGADAEFRERFVDEARNTSAIDHPNIVPIYDFGEVDGMHYIAMRLVDGSDIAARIAGGPLEPRHALDLLEQVADALDTLHKRGLVHLDVKPANALVTTTGSGREHVYVADFGLTRRGATGHHTREGDFLGSPTYAAPEHLRGEPLDGRTDQYALACVLFSCLTGRPPFQGDVPTVIKGHLTMEPPAVTEVSRSRASALPQALDAVLATGMAKQPGGRYASCVELVAAARRALPDPEPSTAAPAAGSGSRVPGQPAPAAGPAGGTGPASVPASGAAAGPTSPGAPQAGTHPAGAPPAVPLQPHGPWRTPYGPAPWGEQGYGPPPVSPYGTPVAPGHQPPAAPLGDPVRLRAPEPAAGAAFDGSAAGGRDRWLVPVLAGVIAVLVLVVLVLLGVAL